MAAGEAPPQTVFAHGYLLVGGEKMSKTRANQIAPADLVADFGVDGFRYHFLADQRFGPDGDFSYEAMVARYNADLANNFGNLAEPRAQHGGELLRRRGARRRAPTVRSSSRRRPRSARLTDAHGGARLLGRLRRGLGAHPRHQLLHRGAAAVGAPQGG